ncbi:MAG TPA: CoA-binding protein [Dissulfurispiraceae bacterium]|nr:CoA-binding protein [Dissulfurispiraceae bacterium]
MASRSLDHLDCPAQFSVFLAGCGNTHVRNMVVMGASPKLERYSHMCLQRLIEMHYTVIPISSAHDVILGRKVYPTISAVSEKIHTVTIYVSAKRQGTMY